LFQADALVNLNPVEISWQADFKIESYLLIEAKAVGIKYDPFVVLA